MSELEGTAPPARILRIGRSPDPWAWPPWEFVGEDGTFGNRWDDPHSTYRVLYASSQLEACFMETLSRFRPDPQVFAQLAQIEGPELPMAPGLLPRTWLAGRVIGEASVSGTFAHVGAATFLAHLHRVLAPRLVHYRIAELDGAAIRCTAPRRFTQEVSSYIYSRSRADGQPLFVGIAYLSRFGDNYENWAIFERPQNQNVIRDPAIRAIDPQGPEFRTALDLLGLRLGA